MDMPLGIIEGTETVIRSFDSDSDEDFDEKLRRAGFKSRPDFARSVGYSIPCVYAWKDKPRLIADILLDYIIYTAELEEKIQEFAEFQTIFKGMFEAKPHK